MFTFTLRFYGFVQAFPIRYPVILVAHNERTRKKTENFIIVSQTNQENTCEPHDYICYQSVLYLPKALTFERNTSRRRKGRRKKNLNRKNSHVSIVQTENERR